MAADEDLLHEQKGLELQELEAPAGIASADIYSRLLALYLHFFDLTNAKFLWKRIPAPVKASSPDLALIWSVATKLWQRDLAGTFEALNREWPNNVGAIMSSLAHRLRRRTVELIARAYSSIRASELASMLGLPLADALSVAKAEAWAYDPADQMVLPVKISGVMATDEQLMSSEQQLDKLTEFVSFLEN